MSVVAQVPSGIKYQTVVRDNNGDILSDAEISFQMSIRLGTPDGQLVYSELQAASTNSFGLVNLVIGQGLIIEGNFNEIDWGTGEYFLEVAVDSQGGNDFEVLGTSQFLSVPFAYHASSLTLTDENGNPYRVKVDANGNLTTEAVWSCGEVFVDPRDSVAYETVQIGNQCWFVDNLSATKFADMSEIPPDNYAIYDYELVEGIDSEEQMIDAYGILYNYAAVGSSKNICPEGWRVSTGNDWDVLLGYVGPTVTGNKLKSCRQVNSSQGGDCATDIHPRWNSGFQLHTDDFGFSGLPAGKNEGSFSQIGSQAMFWTQSESMISKRLWVFTNNVSSFSNTAESNYYSVRCVNENSIAQTSPPSVQTGIVYNVTETSAMVNCEVTNDGGQTVTTRGVVWSDIEDPSIDNNLGFTLNGSGMGEFTAEITGLTNGTVYYVKAYAGNSAGIAYGSQVELTAGVNEAISDIEGNIYKTVEIGNQTWMASNLRTRTYNDGTAIPILDDEAWAAVDYLTNPRASYGLYPHEQINGLDSDEEVMNAYGLVYNYFAVTHEKGICPTGWHVPSNDEIDTLLSNLSLGLDFAGRQLKSCRQVNSPLGGDCNVDEHPRWNFGSADYYGTDDYGFSGLPAGYRTSSGSYTFLGTMTGIATSTIEFIGPPHNIYATPNLRMDFFNDVVFREYWEPILGWSVRCVKDQE